MDDTTRIEPVATSDEPTLSAELELDEPARTAQEVAAAKVRHPAGGESGAHPTLADEVETFGICWFGDPGKGKTSHMAAAARLGKVVYINSEQGLKAGPIRRLGIPLENIEPRPSKAERDRGVEISYKWLWELASEIKDRLVSGESIVAVAWDTGNDMYQRCLQQIVDRAAADGDRDVEYAAEIGDYGDVAQAMRRLIRRYHSLDCHWLVGFHAVRDKDENGAVVVHPNLSDKLLVDMLGYVDAVIYCTAEDPLDSGDEEFTGYCRPVGKYQAKDRYKLLPKRMADPTADRVISYLSEQMTTSADTVQQARIQAIRERAEAAESGRR